MLMGGDFNVTVVAKDRPNNVGGQDPNSEGFWTSILEMTLQEMGLVDCLYTWSMNSCTMPSHLARFLCSI